MTTTRLLNYINFGTEENSGRTQYNSTGAGAGDKGHSLGGYKSANLYVCVGKRLENEHIEDGSYRALSLSLSLSLSLANSLARSVALGLDL